MADTVFNLYDAKTRLSQLVDRAAKAEVIFIAKAGKPLAKLIGIARSDMPRTAGGWEGEVYISDDFDAPLPSEVLAGFDGHE